MVIGTIDLTGLSYFMPVLGFLLVFTIIFALLSKTKLLGENNFIHILLSLVIGVIFVISTSAVKYTETVTAWFAIFIVSLVFILLTIAFVHGNLEDFFKNNAWVGWVILIVLILMFLVAAIRVFPVVDAWFRSSLDWSKRPQVFGAIILFVVAGLASWAVIGGIAKKD